MTTGLAQDRAAVLSRNGVSRETLERLDHYADRLRAWQKTTNLVAPSTLDALWSRHLEEGLRLYPLVGAAPKIVDLGSGGGLPGLVLAIKAKDAQPGQSVTLVESNSKKAAFLRTVIRELALPADVRAERIEQAGAALATADVVTARALASLDVLLGFVSGHIGDHTRCLFPKGRQHEAEIAEASAHWRFDMVKHPSTGEEGSVVLELRSIRPIGA
ncbi:16S rRNA (guanine(527)-N(7))-methyltransferase RsmG [Aureimonas mangrovi]|uniref:16S rRNA (guanine(527)-N(7))-methyltransferase RsmG n=1 Tax=Aureimonas mangrovi TaxID=2758041 RepID=UPI00163DD401|nr:16S rRNA (guanine(527)-N(7))-methyltransferase RsmG [Aureimonas mangrovi]